MAEYSDDENYAAGEMMNRPSRLRMGPFRNDASPLSEQDEPELDGGAGISTDHVFFMINEGKCDVCLDDVRLVKRRPCCLVQLCIPCLTNHVRIPVLEARINIPCPGTDCKVYLSQSEIESILGNRLRRRFRQYYVDSVRDPTAKTCPGCGKEERIHSNIVEEAKGVGHKISCAECRVQWCFLCHAPWHMNATCRDVIREDEELHQWALEESMEARFRARQCPGCAIYIEKYDGCTNVLCIRCRTMFCYECGKICDHPCSCLADVFSRQYELDTEEIRG